MKSVGPMIKPSHRGKLHRALGIPMGQKVPLKKKLAAKHSSNPAMARMGNFAVNFGHKGH